MNRCSSCDMALQTPVSIGAHPARTFLPSWFERTSYPRKAAVDCSIAINNNNIILVLACRAAASISDMP